MSSSGLDEAQLEYAQRKSADILEWIVERYQKKKLMDFKLSDCKDHFKTITECYLIAACAFLQEQQYIIADNTSRIVKYTLRPESVAGHRLVGESDVAPKIGGKKRERKVEQIEETEEEEEGKENRAFKQQPSLKKQKSNHVILSTSSSKSNIQEKQHQQEQPTPSVTTGSGIVENKETHSITVTDITSSGQKFLSDQQIKTTYVPASIPSSSTPIALINNKLRKEEMIAKVSRLLNQVFGGKEELSYLAFLQSSRSELCMSEEEVKDILRHIELQNHIMIEESEGVIYKM